MCVNTGGAVQHSYVTRVVMCCLCHPEKVPLCSNGFVRDDTDDPRHPWIMHRV